MLVMRELTFTSILIRMLVAIVLGGAIGTERRLKNRPAGLRTYVLVCIGACAVMITNQYACQVFGSGDPVRMGAQVVSGVGFLGAGTIMVTSHNQIRGLTTAAGLWATACMGLAVGIGLYEVALVGGLSILAVFALMNEWSDYMRKNARTSDVYIELDKKVSLGDFLRNVRELDIELSDVQMEREGAFTGDVVSFIVTVHGKKHCGHDVLIRMIRKIEGVTYLEEL